MPGKNSDLIKIVLTACISVIVTGVTAWIAFGQGVVDKDYLEHYDHNYSSWAKDKDLVTERMNRISETNLEALKLIKELQKQQTILNQKMNVHLTEEKLKDNLGIESRK